MVRACAFSLVQPFVHNHAGDGVGPVGSALCRLDVIIHYAVRCVVMRSSFSIKGPWNIVRGRTTRPPSSFLSSYPSPTRRDFSLYPVTREYTKKKTSPAVCVLQVEVSFLVHGKTEEGANATFDGGIGLRISFWIFSLPSLHPPPLSLFLSEYSERKLWK